MKEERPAFPTLRGSSGAPGWPGHAWSFQGCREGTSNPSASYLKLAGILEQKQRGREARVAQETPKANS